MTNVKGPNNPRWKGGRQVTFFGYVRVYCPTHPKAIRNLVSEHRLIMERYLQRQLQDGEVVHHRNHDKSDNRIENLELMTNVEHSRQHSLGNRYKKRVLTPRQENQVAQLWQTGKYRMKDIARKFNVGTTAIFSSIHR